MPSRVKVWEGAAQLRRLLVPVGQLHTHPANHRIGDVAKIADSLRRFGQVRAILAVPDGTVISGNHTLRAAVEVLGWTHIAAVVEEMPDGEALAYLAADNELSDLARYDPKRRAQLLEQISTSTQGLLGTGVTKAAYERAQREAHKAVAAATRRTQARKDDGEGGLRLQITCPSCQHKWNP